MQGRRALGPIRVGIFSNGGACVYLGYQGALATRAPGSLVIQVIGRGSVLATRLITRGLIIFGIGGGRPCDWPGRVYRGNLYSCLTH